MLALTHQGLWFDCNKTRNITAQNSPLAVTGSLILVIYLRKCGEPKSYDIPARLQPSTKSGGTLDNSKLAPPLVLYPRVQLCILLKLHKARSSVYFTISRSAKSSAIHRLFGGDRLCRGTPIDIENPPLGRRRKFRRRYRPASGYPGLVLHSIGSPTDMTLTTPSPSFKFCVYNSPYSFTSRTYLELGY